MQATSENVRIKSANPLRSYFAGIVILVCIIVGQLIYWFIMGAPDNFEGGDPANHPLPGNWLGLIYKGGPIVGLAIALLLIVITTSIERMITLGRASGKGSADVFVQRIQIHLENNDVQQALDECDKQRGTVGNVVKSALLKYKEMAEEVSQEQQGGSIVGGDEKTIVVADVKDKEQRQLAIQKALDEATALELPMLERHLIIIATLVSVATLVGLIGTVIGMIKAFAALATAGAPDAVALANGISEALVNTAMGITTSAIATVLYNYFTSRIDTMTYRIDEAGYSIVQTFAEKY